MLRAELKKIEARKKEREKKTQDLQKLILQADTTASKSPTSAGVATNQVLLRLLLVKMTDLPEGKWCDAQTVRCPPITEALKVKGTFF